MSLEARVNAEQRHTECSSFGMKQTAVCRYIAQMTVRPGGLCLVICACPATGALVGTLRASSLSAALARTCPEDAELWHALALRMPSSGTHLP